MPIVEIHILEGYDSDAKTRLGQAVTQAVRSVIPAVPDAITVITHEMPGENYMRGGTTRHGAPALPDHAGVVRAFLSAMEARDLEAAGTYLGAGFAMHFPGAAPMNTLSQLVDWAQPRYRFVKKTYEQFDQAMSDAGPVVYCYGTLHGEWPDGAAFEGIRFIDRFQFSEGLIVRQTNSLGRQQQQLPVGNYERNIFSGFFPKS